MATNSIVTQAEPSATHWLTTSLWVAPLLACVFLTKIGVPPFSAQGIGIVAPLLLAVTLVGCCSGNLQVSPPRLVAGLLVLALLGITQLLKNDVFFISSLLLLAALHLPFLFTFSKPLPEALRVADLFVSFCAICSLLGIAQFFLQGHVPTAWLFPIDNFVPTPFLVQNFNEQAPLEYGSELLRANGVFMMEPSYLSQLLAVALVLELATRSRLPLLAILAAGLLVSYSGTGFMILAVCLPLVAVAQRRWAMLGLCVGLAIVALIAARNGVQVLHLDKLLARVAEFDSTGSSGFARFVGGFYLFDQYLWAHPVHALFGTGAGTFKVYGPQADYPVAEMPLFKMVLEFGVLGALLYFAFLFYCLSFSRWPRAVTMAVGMTFLLNGLYIPFSHAMALGLVIWTGTEPVGAPARRAAVTPVRRYQAIAMPPRPAEHA